MLIMKRFVIILVVMISNLCFAQLNITREVMNTKLMNLSEGSSSELNLYNYGGQYQYYITVQSSDSSDARFKVYLGETPVSAMRAIENLIWIAENKKRHVTVNDNQSIACYRDVDFKGIELTQEGYNGRALISKKELSNVEKYFRGEDNGAQSGNKKLGYIVTGASLVVVLAVILLVI